MTQLHIVGIGGTTQPGSSTETALKLAMAAAEQAGARTTLFDGPSLAKLPLYLTLGYERAGDDLVAAVRSADGVMIAAPGYHGTISGLVKNAIDYLEETAKDARVYLDDIPVGLIVTAYGWQTTGTTLATLRSMVHALRGWPTPLGAAINSSGGIFKNGECSDPGVITNLNLVGKQVTAFARMAKNNPAIINTGE